jgi:tetratricopeptide (TPR) repeat protein
LPEGERFLTCFQEAKKRISKTTPDNMPYARHRSPDPGQLQAALRCLKQKRSQNQFSGMAEAHYALGEIVLMQNNPEKAEQHFRQAIALSDKLPWAYICLGRLLEAKGLGREAEKAYLGAERAGAEEVAVLLEIGTVHLQRGAVKKAGHYFRRAVRLGAPSSRAYLLIADILRAHEMYTESVRWLKEAAQLNPDVPCIQFKLGWACGMLHNFAEMRACFRRYLRLEKAGGKEGVGRIIAWLCLADFGKASAEAEAAMDDLGVYELELLSEPWPDARLCPLPMKFYLGLVKGLSGRVEKEPGSPWLRFFLYLALSKAEHPGGIAASLNILGKFPGKRYGWMRSGIAKKLLVACQFKAAALEFTAVLRSRPQLVKARCLLAEAYLCLGRPREAFEEFSRAEADAGSGKGYVLGWRGEALLWAGRYEEALACLDRAVNSGCRMAICWRGAAKMLSGKLDDALYDLDQVINTGHHDAEALIWRAEVKRRQGRYKEALADLEKALPIEEGNHEWVYFNLALVKAELGELSGMWEAYEKIPVKMTDYLKGRLGWGRERPRTRNDVRHLLAHGLGLARGDRRPEAYVRAVWMGEDFDPRGDV